MRARIAIGSSSRRRRIAAGALLVALVVPWGITARWSFPVFLASLAMALAGAVILVQAPPKKQGASARVVDADENGLSIDEEPKFARNEIVRAYAGDSPADGPTVHVEATGGRALTLFLYSKGDAKRILEALALPPAEGTTELRAYPPWAKKLRYLMLALSLPSWSLIQLVHLLPTWTAYAVAALYGAAMLPLVFAQRVNVGDDGVSLTWVGRRRFVPFRQIIAAAASEYGIHLVLDGGRILEISLARNERAMPPERDLLLERIKAGIARHKELTPAEEEALLARRGRDLETWLRELRAFGEETTAGYRGLAVPRERLWAIVESVSADPSAREGAALALHASLDDAERARLASLAKASASPRLRVALDAVSTTPDGAKLRIALDGADTVEEEALSDAMPTAQKAKTLDR